MSLESNEGHLQISGICRSRDDRIFIKEPESEGMKSAMPAWRGIVSEVSTLPPGREL
jgi:hypothetical protein